MMNEKWFVEILKRYGHIIENKRSDSATLREKELAWNQISDKYNNNAKVSTTRTVQQLKKLWTNLKHTQRDSLTQERQSRYATGGGPEAPEAKVDPDVAVVAPSLMTTAPTYFSNNMADNNITGRREAVFIDPGVIYNVEVRELGEVTLENMPSTSAAEEVQLRNETEPESQDSSAIDLQAFTDPESQSEGRASTSANSIAAERGVRRSCSESPRKRPRISKSDCGAEENELRAERIRRIIKHEEKMHELAIDFTKRKYAMELRALEAAAHLAELQLQREKEKLLPLLE